MLRLCSLAVKINYLKRSWTFVFGNFVNHSIVWNSTLLRPVIRNGLNIIVYIEGV